MRFTFKMRGFGLGVWKNHFSVGIYNRDVWTVALGPFVIYYWRN